MGLDMKQPFIILGAGAIGCYLGARLTKAGHKTIFVGRPSALELLSRHGLHVSDQDGLNEKIQPNQLHLCTSLRHAMDSLQDRASEAVILVCVKGTGTLQAAIEIAQCCAAGTVVISMQNGVGNVDRIRSIAPQANVFAGMVPFTVMWRNDHHVHRANGGTLQVQHSANTQALIAPMAGAGIPFELQDNMVGIQWGKLLINLLNPVNALADIPIREQLLQRDFRLVYAALQTEALGILKAAGIRPAKVAAVAPAVVPHILRLPNWLFTRVAAGMLKTDPGAKTSMCVDLRNGRPTEIEDLCGEVVRFAQEQSISAPLNSKVRDMIQCHTLGETWSGPRLRQALKI